VGAEDVQRDDSLTAVRALGDYLQLVWSVRTRQGFFLRAEDFFGYVKRLAQMEGELLAELRRVEKEYAGRSEKARQFARMPFASELHALRGQYGRNLNNFSHGESFLELFQSRLQPGGLYLLDEPEAPLSPTRQLTLLSMMAKMVRKGAQFIIATHSPILLAYPDALILSFDGGAIQPADYETLEHVVVTRAFLENPAAYLRHLVE
jgi:predicted ATPase